MARRTSLVFALVLVGSACSNSVSFPGTTTTTIEPQPTTTAPVTTTEAPVTTTTLAPPPPAEPIRVAVVGDFGTGSSEEYQVAALIEAMAGDDPIEALVTTGDNFYNDDVERIWQEPFGWVDETGVALHAAWGNHDIETQSRVDLVAEHMRPPFWCGSRRRSPPATAW